MRENFESRTLGTSLLTLLFGILLLLSPVAVAKTAVQAAGIGCVLFGVISLIRALQAGRRDSDLVIGIIAIVIGLLVAANALAILNAIPFFLGIYLLANGALKLSVYVPSAVPDLIFGVILLLSGFGLFSFALKIIGFIMIIIAVLDIAGVAAFRRR